MGIPRTLGGANRRRTRMHHSGFDDKHNPGHPFWTTTPLLLAGMAAWQSTIEAALAFAMLVVVIILLYACGQMAKEREERPLATHSTYTRVKRTWQADVSSCPVGGGCLVCGAPIREELSVRCPVCGAERVRCPICQRFVARGQDLLACPHCKVLGHANEVHLWVSKHKKCPHCGRPLTPSQLVTFEELQQLTSSQG